MTKATIKSMGGKPPGPPPKVTLSGSSPEEEWDFFQGELLPFTSNPCCPKCQNSRNMRGFYLVYCLPGHLRVACNVCGYKWAMATADEPKDEPWV